MRKKCKCGEMFSQYLSTQTKCTKCLIKKQKEIEKKLWNTEKKRLKGKLKTYAQKVLEARRIFQKWIRKRDEKQNCISCNCKTSSMWDAGHYLKAEIYSGLVFEETNVHKQCRKCNHFLGGNELGYRDGLIKRYGIAYVLELENKKLTGRYYKWSDEELETIKTKYKIK